MANASWWDNNWNYRVAITINNAVENQTGKLDIDFNALGLPGVLDKNSVRVVKEDGTLLSKQEFTDVLYDDTTDSLDNDKGEIKFIIEDDGDITYYVYYDNLDNGNKIVLEDSYYINGNFEHSNGAIPTGWVIGSADIGSNAPNSEVHSQSSEGNSVSVTDDGGSGETKTVENRVKTGDKFYLYGYRSRQESEGKSEKIWIEKTFFVPSTNSGTFSYWFRIQGWDQITSNTGYDRFRFYVNGTIINPNNLSINNSDVRLESEAYGKNSSYDTFGDLGWTQATLDLSSYAGTSITIKMEQEAFSDDGYKTWQLVDDVEWSKNSAITIGGQEEAPKAKITMVKNSCVIFDTINGTNNPKRISGSIIRYAIEVKNSGTADADNVIVEDRLSSNFDATTIKYLQIKDKACSCLGVSSLSNNGVNGTENGINPVKLDFGMISMRNDDDPTIKCGYFEVKIK